MAETTAGTKTEIYRENYSPPDFVIPKVSLFFDLKGDKAIVRSRCSIERKNSDAIALVLDGSPHFTLVSVSMNGVALKASEYISKTHSLEIPVNSDAFELEIITEMLPAENKRLEGLYFSGGNFCTQCEAEGFRHITYFLDRPDVLSTYVVRIEAEKKTCPVLLSNGNPKAAADLGNGRHFAVWEDPFPKPCYLFALVAGDLALNSSSFLTRDGRDVALNVYVAPSDIDKSDFALEALARSMKWDEERFGLIYDLDVYNIVAVSDFNMGAMENKGLNIFNTKYVLASPETATDADFDHVEGVIGHEYFHNWTGNRVTCRDWFQLSLKEGLTVFRDQEFSSDIGARAIKRIDDVQALRMHQFMEDASPLAHPVRPDKYIEINNFYTATVYNKGAEVIRMMHLLLGESAFQKGMQLYFERFDAQAVTCEDFVQCMEDASNVNLALFRLWYSQAGTPQLEVARKRKGQDVSIVIEQSCPATPGQAKKQALHVPILMNWINKNGDVIFPEAQGNVSTHSDGFLLELQKPRDTFTFCAVPEGAVPSFLEKFSAPVKISDDLSSSEKATIIKYSSDSFARWEAMQELASDYLMAKINSASSQKDTDFLIEVFRQILSNADNEMDITSLLLTLPSEISLGQKSQLLDAEGIHNSREQLVSELANCFSTEILNLYENLQNKGSYSLAAADKAQRRLRNSLLPYIAHMEGEEGLIHAHYHEASNMTDRLAALNSVARNDFSFSEDVLQQFYLDWRHDALVLDKWFAVQAADPRADAINGVVKLSNHEDFSVSNPNRLRSLVSTFSVLNQSGFHRGGSESYEFLADMILKVDNLNPQTAARLVAPLGRWAKLPTQNKQSAKDALSDILKQPSVSADVRELCDKALNS
jgi:aminopeptidase N